jgi:hypothetical protein
MLRKSLIQSITGGFSRAMTLYGTARLENSIIETFNAHVVNCTTKFEILLLAWLVDEPQ